MKLRTLPCILGCAALLPAMFAGSAAADTWTAEQTRAYFCTEAHDATYYLDITEAEKLSVWNFEGGIVPQVEARKQLFGTGKLNDATRTGQCTKTDEFIDAVDAITESERVDLRKEYRNDNAISELTAKKFDLQVKASKSEMQRKTQMYPQ